MVPVSGARGLTSRVVDDCHGGEASSDASIGKRTYRDALAICVYRIGDWIVQVVPRTGCDDEADKCVEVAEMAKATECIIAAGAALQLRTLIQKSGKRLGRVFRCKQCGKPVKVMVDSSVGVAHFEHFERNVDCSLSDKRTIKRAYSVYKTKRTAAGE
jgi:hypothetical protein